MSKTSAIIHVSHLPAAFSEKEVRQFFGQFGTIRKLRLSRSPKTARTRGYGYIQYQLPEIAAIAAEATNNYFIGGKPMRVEHMKPESVLPGLFKGHNKKFVDTSKIRGSTIRKKHNRKAHGTTDESKLEKDSSIATKLASAGVDYVFPRKVVDKKVKKTI